MSGKTSVLLAALIFILFAPACQAQPTAAPTIAPTFTPPPARLPATEAEVPRATVEEAKAAADTGTAVIVDVRSPQAFEVSHIAGALPIPLADIEANPTGLNLDKNQWIITYCTWMNEHTSARAAFVLLQNGYPRASALLGGFQAWIEAGLPLEQ